MNVAVTRARRMLIVVGDSDCVSVDPHIKTLIEWLGEKGMVQTAEELKSDPLVRFGLGRVVDVGMEQQRKGDQARKSGNNVEKIKKKKSKPVEEGKSKIEDKRELVKK